MDGGSRPEMCHRFREIGPNRGPVIRPMDQSSQTQGFTVTQRDIGPNTTNGSHINNNKVRLYSRADVGTPHGSGHEESPARDFAQSVEELSGRESESTRAFEEDNAQCNGKRVLDAPNSHLNESETQLGLADIVNRSKSDALLCQFSKGGCDVEREVELHDDKANGIKRLVCDVEEGGFIPHEVLQALDEYGSTDSSNESIDPAEDESNKVQEGGL